MQVRAQTCRAGLMEGIDEIYKLVSQLWYAEQGRWLNNLQSKAFRGSLSDKTYSEIGAESHHESGSVKQAVQPVFRFLTDLLGIKVNKRNCISVLPAHLSRLRQLVDERLTPAEVPAEPGLDVAPPEAIDTSRPDPSTSDRGGRLVSTKRLMGRDADLDYLSARIRQRPGQIVVLTGLPQSGQTLLANHLRASLAKDFTLLPVLQAHGVPTVVSLLAAVSQAAELDLAVAPPADAQVALLQILATERLLLVIDNLERLFQPGELAGRFEEGSACYERWLEQLVHASLQSCVILVTRVTPYVLQQYSSMRLETASFTLHALKGWPPEFARQWLQERGVEAQSEAEWQELLAFCGGHPDLLDNAAAAILNDYGRDTARFLGQPVMLLTRWKRWILNQLTAVEQALIPWLLHRTLSYSDVTALWIPGFRSDQLVQGLASLERRGLVVRRDRDGRCQLYSLAIGRSIAAIWIDQLLEELQTGQLHWLHNYPLLQCDGPLWRDQQQRRYVIAPLVDEFQRLAPTRAERQARLEQAIASIRQQNTERVAIGRGDYGIGNLLNIAIALGIPLRAFDVSGTRLHQVDLRHAEIAGWQAQNCEFEKVLYPVPVAAPLRAAIAPAGDWLVIGDANGQLTCWQGTAPDLNLSVCYQFEAAIAAIAVAAGLVAAAVGHTVQLFFLGENSDPEASDAWVEPQVLEVSASVSYLTLDQGAFKLAAGLEDGQIVVWDLLEEACCFAAAVHSRGISRLVFSADGGRLASYGSGDRVCCAILNGDRLGQVADPLPIAYGGSFIGLGWDRDRLSVIEHLSPSNRVMWRTQTDQQMLANDAAWVMAVCSQNGRVIAGHNITSGLVRICDRPSATAKPTTTSLIPVPDQEMPKIMELSSHGDVLLIGTDTVIQLWETATGQCLWQCQAVAADYSGHGCDLSGTGMPPWHGRLLSTIGVTWHPNQP